MSHTLATMLGRSRGSKHTGYRETTGRFPDDAEERTAFFGLALSRPSTDPVETEICSGNLAEDILPSRSR